MPPIAPADNQTPQWFTEGGAGLPATYPGQDWFNQIQAELLNVLKAADISPQKGSLNQLSSAISKLASAYAVSIVHSTGQSLTSVMSQNAVTGELNKKFDKTGGRVDGTVSSKVIKVSEDDGEELFLYPASGDSPAFMQYHKGGVWSGKFLIPKLAANKILAPLMPGDVYSNTEIDTKINAIFSVGQKLTDVKSVRAFNSVYSNSTGRAIQLAVNVQCNNWAGQSTLHIGPSDGSISLSFRLLDWAVAATQVAPVFIVIPDKWNYRITDDTGGLVIQSWLEYR
ncbi:hypothetical protein L9G70_07885 [Morganella morganii]